MVGHITGMIFARNHKHFSADNKEGVHSWCGELSLTTELPIFFLKDRQCSENYQKMLKSHLLLFGKFPTGGRMDISARQLLHSRVKLYYEMV